MGLGQPGDPVRNLVLQFLWTKTLIRARVPLEEESARPTDVSYVIGPLPFEGDEAIPLFPCSAALYRETERRLELRTDSFISLSNATGRNPACPDFLSCLV